MVAHQVTEDSVQELVLRGVDAFVRLGVPKRAAAAEELLRAVAS